MDEVSRQEMPLGKFDEEKANTSSVILANARMPPSPTGEGLEYIPPSRMIIKRSESVLAQASERRLLLGALGEAEQSAKRKAQRCFAPKGVYPTTTLLMIYRFVETDDMPPSVDDMHGKAVMICHFYEVDGTPPRRLFLFHP